MPSQISQTFSLTEFFQFAASNQRLASPKMYSFFFQGIMSLSFHFHFHYFSSCDSIRRRENLQHSNPWENIRYKVCKHALCDLMNPSVVRSQCFIHQLITRVEKEELSRIIVTDEHNERLLKYLSAREQAFPVFREVVRFLSEGEDKAALRLREIVERLDTLDPLPTGTCVHKRFTLSLMWPAPLLQEYDTQYMKCLIHFAKLHDLQRFEHFQKCPKWITKLQIRWGRFKVENIDCPPSLGQISVEEKTLWRENRHLTTYVYHSPPFFNDITAEDIICDTS